ncbi:MAG: ABC transporter permease subunit [Chloroflexi bacterium]|nr:ABC transporter permease subunit [Chloroflexota bacterium]MXX83550.1 ABC transporter permease subunit [Chloroflexota bacterium]
MASRNRHHPVGAEAFPEKTKHYMPGEKAFYQRLEKRHQRGRLGRLFNLFSVSVAGLALIALFLNVANEAFGTIGVVNTIEPAALTGGPALDTLTNEELAAILLEHVGRRLRVFIRDTISQVPKEDFTKATVTEIVGDPNVDPAIADELLKSISHEDQAALLAKYADNATLRRLVLEEVVEQQVIASFPLSDTIFNFETIKAQIEGPILADYIKRQRLEAAEVTVIRFHSWLDSEFLTKPMSSAPALAGVRTALIGSAGLMIVVVLVALPIGVGAAIYLEEYAHRGLINRLIETNVRNLAGVPSIIYGMLGLAIFVRALAPFTSGMVFHVNFEAPTIETVVERISPVFVGGITYENGALSADSAQLDEQSAQQLVDVFLRYGTPSLTMQGNSDVSEMADALAEALDMTVDVVVTRVSKPHDIEMRGKAYRFDVAEGSLDDEAFDALMSSLARSNSFSPNGRTLLSAGLTLALLILPIIIINAQEAIRAVPYTIREASYGLGATRWQTIWRQILPAATPGIMTGTILSVSRAVGETAPLIVVGAATFLLTDPTSPFSQFTAMPIQIYQWTARPQGQFADIAAAAIIVLLALMLALNAVAIVLRNRYSIRF